MHRKIALVLSTLYLAIAGIVAIALLQASPGPSEQDIYGIGIGTPGSSQGSTYISGRRLDCMPLQQPASFTSQCSIPISGKQLTIFARHNNETNLNHFDGICQALYDGQNWPCIFGWRHAHTPWFVYLDRPLSLPVAELDSLQQQFWIENLPETAIFQLIQVSTIVSTSVAAGATLLWFWPMRRNKMMALSSVCIVSLFTCVGSSITALLITGSFWD